MSTRSSHVLPPSRRHRGSGDGWSPVASLSSDLDCRRSAVVGERAALERACGASRRRVGQARTGRGRERGRCHRRVEQGTSYCAGQGRYQRMAGCRSLVRRDRTTEGGEGLPAGLGCWLVTLVARGRARRRTPRQVCQGDGSAKRQNCDRRSRDEHCGGGMRRRHTSARAASWTGGVAGPSARTLGYLGIPDAAPPVAFRARGADGSRRIARFFRYGWRRSECDGCHADRVGD